MMNSVLVNSKESTNRARPCNLFPVPLSAKCIHPRIDVFLERISQSFSPLRILSSHSFLTTRAILDDRFKPLLAPAFCLILLSWVLVLPLLPMLIGGLRLPLFVLLAFGCLLPLDRVPLRIAFVLKHDAQNVALTDFANWLHRWEFRQFGTGAMAALRSRLSHRNDSSETVRI